MIFNCATARTARFASLLAAALLCLAATVRADDDDAQQRDEAMESVRSGQIRPLTEIREAVLARFPGEILHVKINREHGIFVYEFRMLRDDGHVLEVEVNAANAAILEVENE